MSARIERLEPSKFAAGHEFIRLGEKHFIHIPGNFRPIIYIITKEGCHKCVSHKPTAHGYPQIGINKKKLLVHRYIYELNNGPISAGMIVMHICDNRICINPEHLILGTHADNAADRVKKGRQAVGMNNGMSRLTEVDIMKILKNDSHSYVKIAKKFGVDPSLIIRIKKGKLWKCVHAPG